MHLFTFTYDLIYFCKLLIIFINIKFINKGSLLSINQKIQKLIKEIKSRIKNKLLI